MTNAIEWEYFTREYKRTERRKPLTWGLVKSILFILVVITPCLMLLILPGNWLMAFGDILGSYQNITVTATPDYGYFYPPTQGSGYATDVILWHGETQNVIASLNIANLEDDMTNAAGAGAAVITDELTDITGRGFIFLFCFGLAFLGMKLRFFRIAAGLAILISGWTFFNTTALTILMVVAGLGLISDGLLRKGSKAA